MMFETSKVIIEHSTLNSVLVNLGELIVIKISLREQAIFFNQILQILLCFEFYL